MPESTPHRIRLRLELGGPGAIVINQLYFPGFKLLVGGKTVLWQGRDSRSALRDHATGVTASPSQDGRIQLSFVTGGTYLVEEWYDGPPGWPLRNAVIAIVSGALVIAFRYNSFAGHRDVSSKSTRSCRLLKIVSSALKCGRRPRLAEPEDRC